MACPKYSEHFPKRGNPVFQTIFRHNGEIQGKFFKNPNFQGKLELQKMFAIVRGKWDTPRNRADLSVEGQHIEVKGLATLNPNTIEARLKHAFTQIHGDDDRYHSETHKEGKVILLSRHDNGISDEQILNAMRKGFLSAEHKGYVTGKLEVWIRGKIYALN